MRFNQILVSSLILLGAVFLGLQFKHMEFGAMGVRSLAMLVLTVYYLIKTEKKSLYFLMFLSIFTIADITNFLTWYAKPTDPNAIDYWFYIINSLYILSYLFLITRIVGNWNFLEIIKEYKYQMLLLIIMDVFFVYMVTNTTSAVLSLPPFSVDLIYNSIIMLLLAISLINYMYHDDNKSMNLLLGAIFIVFSEVIQLAYFYISDIQLLNMAYSLFLVFAFVFFFIQSQLAHREKIDYIGEEIQTES